MTDSRMNKNSNRIVHSIQLAREEDAIANGKSIAEQLTKLYDSCTLLSQISGMDTIETVSPTWESRPKSNIVKWLMDKSGRSLEDIAMALGCTTSYLNNKLHRDSFSLDDMIVVAYICGYALTFTSNNPDDKERSTFQIDVQDYFSSSNKDALERLYRCERQIKARKRAEYEALKTQLEKMKAQYGFED